MVLHHADQVLPCADFFNPGWEVEIGSSQGAIEHRNKFKRKIDPIVNGIADMQVSFLCNALYPNVFRLTKNSRNLLQSPRSKPRNLL